MSVSVSSERISVVIDRCHTQFEYKKKGIKRPPPYIKLVIMPARLISGSRGEKVFIHQVLNTRKIEYEETLSTGDVGKKSA